jgi:hypothetical protein
MEEIRKRTVSNQFQQMHDRRREHNMSALTAAAGGSFADCLGPDPFRFVHAQKQKLRHKNIEIT